MANIRSAAKRIRVAQRQTRVNGVRRSRMRTMVKRARTAIDAKDQNGFGKREDCRERIATSRAERHSA